MNLLTRFRQQIGLLKSVAIYYWKPFSRLRLRNFYSQFIEAGDLCFDIGAHVGNRTAAWSSLGATVIVVEPQPVCVRYLRRKFEDYPRVVIVDQAIGASAGEATMVISSANPTISTLSHRQWREQIARDSRYPITWDMEEVVQVTTLDQLIDKFGLPRFCKLDVENSEYEALQGLSHAIPVLSFEYYPPVIENFRKCLDRLQELGTYEFNWSFGETMRLESRKWLTSDALEHILGGFTRRSKYGDVYARIMGETAQY